MAPPLQVPVPARPRLVRPPAVHQVPRELARVLAQGQDRRLVGGLHEGDGAQLLGLQRGHPRPVRRGCGRVDRRRGAPPRRRHRGAGRAHAEAAGDGDGHVRRAQRAGDPRRRDVRGRHPPLQRAHRQRGLRRSQVHRARVEQLGSRHLRCPVGERRRRDDDPALVDAHRPLRHADGARPRRPLLRAGARQRRDDRARRPDLRLHPVPHPAHVPDPRVRGDGTGRRRLLPAPGEGRASCSTGATTARACS